MKNDREVFLEKMLGVIKKNPGIRPRELHKILGLKHSWPLRKALIKKGLVKKVRKGNAVHYYAEK